MGRNRFNEPAVDRIPLSDGDWIEVKRDLDTGDAKKLEAAGMKNPIRMENGEIYTPIDWEVYELHRAMIFLTDWSFCDSTAKPRKLSLDALRALKPPDFEEINTAIYSHIFARAKEKADAKNDSRATSSGNTVSFESPASDQK